MKPGPNPFVPDEVLTMCPKSRSVSYIPGKDPDNNGGQERNRTTDTRIFSRVLVRFWPYISIS